MGPARIPRHRPALQTCRSQSELFAGKYPTPERAIRSAALGRKNHLFAGSATGGQRWATIGSLIETCKLNGVEPYAYLKDVLEKMVEGYPANRLHELLPWAWKAYATTPA